MPNRFAALEVPIGEENKKKNRFSSIEVDANRKPRNRFESIAVDIGEDKNTMPVSDYVEAAKNKTDTVGSFFKGFTHNFDDYAASVNKLLGLDEGAKYWERQRKMNEVETEDHPISKFAGSVLLDPLNLVGGEAIKAGKIGKAALQEAMTGAGSTALHDYGDSSLSEEEKLQRALAGGLIGGAAGGTLAAHLPSRLLKRGPEKIPAATREAIPAPDAPREAKQAAEAILQNPEAFGLGDAAMAVKREAETPGAKLPEAEVPQAKAEPEPPQVEVPQAQDKSALYDYVVERARDRSAKDIRYGKRLESPRRVKSVGVPGVGWETQVDRAVYSPNYEADFLLTKGDVKKIEAGKTTPEIEEKIHHDMQVMTEHPDWKEEGEAILSGKKPTPLDAVKLNEAGDLVGADGVPIFANAGHNLAAGVGAGTLNAFMGEYDPNRDFMDQIGEKFLEGLAAGTLGTAAIRQLRHIAPESYERVRRAVLEHSYREPDGTIRLKANSVKIGTFAGSAPRFAPADSPRPAGNFDDLERLAKERENKGWSDIAEQPGLGDVGAFLKENFTDTFSGAYHAARDATHAAIQKEQAGIERLARALNGLDEGSDKELHRYLTGQSDGSALSEPVRNLADAIRGRVDTLGQELVDEGILSPEAFKEWEGVYLHRLYEPHFDPTKLVKRGFKVDTIHERGESLSTGDYNKALSWLQKRGYLNDEQTEALKSDPGKSVKALADYLEEAGITGALKEGKISAQMLPGDRIKLRRDWSPSERQEMGEIESAKLAVPETLSKLVRMREHARFLRRAAETEGVTLDAKSAAQMDPEAIKRAGYVKVSGRPYGALSGQWVRRDVAEDIGHTYKQLTDEYRSAWKIWRSYYGKWKKSVTVWNPRAHFNNFVGNLFLMHLGGVDAAKVPGLLTKGFTQIKALKNLEELETKKLLHGLSREEERKLAQLSQEARYAKEAKGLGIFGRSQLNDILAGMERSPQKSGVLSRLDAAAQHYYQAEDNFNRLSFYTTLREAGKSPERAKAMVDMLLPDYSQPLPKGWRFLRDSGVSPFISWAYYTVPNMMKMAKTKTGARRLATVLGALSAMEYFGSGEQVNPWDNLPFVKGNKPQDFKGRRFVFGHDGSQMHTVKLDNAIPYIGVMQDPYNFLTSQISGPIPNLLYAIRGRRLYDGRTVTYPNKSAGDQALDWGKYLLNQYVPLPAPAKDALSLIDSALRSKNKRRRNKTVVPRSTGQELLKAVGLNTLSYDKDKIKH